MMGGILAVYWRYTVVGGILVDIWWTIYRHIRLDAPVAFWYGSASPRSPFGAGFCDTLDAATALAFLPRSEMPGPLQCRRPPLVAGGGI